MIEIRHFQTGDERAFFDLNKAWIEGNFAIEEKDLEVLNDPTGHILETGGVIFIASQDDVPVGTCALLAMREGEFEVAKMTVAEQCRGLGIGRKLLAHTIEHARANSAKRLYLETNHRLQPAIHVYESLGFRHLPPEKVVPSPYVRADVFMELLL